MPSRTRSLPEAAPPPVALTPKDRRTRSAGAVQDLQKMVDRARKGQPERRSYRDRRATPRVKVAVVLEAVAGAGSRRFVTFDLSTFGLSIAKGATPKKGLKLAIKLFLPDEPTSPALLDAVVLGPFDDHGGLRLKFLSPEVAVVRRIHRLVK